MPDSLAPRYGRFGIASDNGAPDPRPACPYKGADHLPPAHRSGRPTPAEQGAPTASSLVEPTHEPVQSTVEAQGRGGAAQRR